MKLNRGAAPVQDGTPEVVVDQGPRTAAQRLEGRDMPAEETLERLVQRKERKQGAGIAEDHDEAGDGADAVTNPD